jgi:hypothetical protein
MIDDDIDTCLKAIRARWPYQPLSDDERKAWRRHLRQVNLEDFGNAIDIVVANGGSKTASQPGMRPSVAEFMDLVHQQATRRQRAEDQARREAERAQEPDTPPEVASQRIAEIKDELRAKGVRCG